METENIDVQVETNPLHTVTPVSKYLAMALFIIMPFLGGWIGYTYAPEKVVEVERVVEVGTNAGKDLTSSSQVTETYADMQNGITFDYPAHIFMNPDTAVFSTVTFDQFSKEQPIYDYQSCCTGTRYWYNSTTSEWLANSILAGQYDDAGKAIPDPETAVSLLKDDMCVLEEKFGEHTFYKIKSGDEGAPTDFYYFLLTDQGFALRFTSSYDVRGSDLEATEVDTSDSDARSSFARTLSSVKLSNDVSEIKATCI